MYYPSDQYITFQLSNLQLHLWEKFSGEDGDGFGGVFGFEEGADGSPAVDEVAVEGVVDEVAGSGVEGGLVVGGAVLVDNGVDLVQWRGPGVRDGSGRGHRL